MTIQLVDGSQVSHAFILEHAYLLPGDIALAAGSLVEGYGNRYSDIDVYVLTTRYRRAHEIDLERHHRVISREREIVRGGDAEVMLIHTVVPKTGVKVDIEFRLGADVDALLASMDRTYRYCTENLVLFSREIPMRDKLFMHRLYAGQPIVNAAGLADLRASFDIRKYWYVLYRTLASDFSQLLDIMGAWDSGELLRCADIAYREMFREMMAYLHLRGQTCPHPKWLLAFLPRIPPSDADLAERFLALCRGRSLASDDACRNYVVGVLDFLDVLYARTAQLLEDCELFPSGERAIQLLDRDAERADHRTAYSHLEYAYRKKVYGRTGHPTRSFLQPEMLGSP